MQNETAPQTDSAADIAAEVAAEVAVSEQTAAIGGDTEMDRISAAAMTGAAPTTAASTPTASARREGKSGQTAACHTVSVLGATGSIGTSTLDLIGRSDGALKVVALTAHRNVAKLAELALAAKAELAVIGDEALYPELKERLAGTGIESAAGESGLLEAGSRPADCIMASIMGAAGLKPTFAAVAQGTRLALANKECLVSAGSVFMDAIKAAGAELLPVDSEHSAAFQALEGAQPEDIERIVLTASGGPFRNSTLAELKGATVEQALKHPNWSMGQKITIDSASMMNKGLELIEAYYLFPVAPEQLDVLVHPQSIVHCLVEYTDGSVLAQLASPDMRTPIAYALSWPRRMTAPTARLDLVTQGPLSFEKPDMERFPALKVAREALTRGGGAPLVLNAANEVAVEAFLQRRIGFLEIAQLVQDTMEAGERRNLLEAPQDLDGVLMLDQEARALAQGLLQGSR